jgi:hypothetical protein
MQQSGGMHAPCGGLACEVLRHEILLEALKQQETPTLILWQVRVLRYSLPPPGLGLAQV